jgi:hypothetical protein
MQDRSQDNLLRHVPIFQNLPDTYLSLVAQAFQVEHYNRGDFIFQQGERTRGLHLLVDGHAVLFRGLPTGQYERLGTVQRGNYLNDAAIFQDGTQTATLQALNPVIALVLTRQNMALLLTQYPDLSVALGFGVPIQPQPDPKLKAQRENEAILLKTRRHWWAYIRYMWLPVLIAIPLWILMIFLPVAAPIIIPLSLLVVAAAGGYLYFEWANDSVTITDQRIVRVTRAILTFTEIRDEVAIDSVQEVNAEMPPLDPFARLFDYGQVELKTAGVKGNFILDFMPHPQDIQTLIKDYQSQRKEQKVANERDLRRAELEGWLNAPQSTSQVVGVAKPKAKKSDKKNAEEQWLVGDGPLSPFVSKFTSDKGATVYRKHWSVWLRAVLLPVMWLVAGFAVLLITLVIPAVREFGIIGYAAGLVMLLLGGGWYYYSDWDWRHDYYVINDTHIIIINQRPLWIKNEIEQLLLKQVDNVVAETRGIWQRIFKYGDVRVALIGADTSKTFDNVANPLDIQQEITKRQARIKQQEAEAQAKQQREAIGQYISLYHETYSNTNQAEFQPPDNMPRAATLRDRNRPTVVPRQNPPQPSMSEGRIYQPHNPDGYEYQRPAQPSPYDYAPPQPGQYPVQPPNQPAAGYNYSPPPAVQPPVQPTYYPPPAAQPPVQPTYPPQQPMYPPQPINPNPQGQYSAPTQPNLNPPPPPPERDSGRPPKFRRRRTDN